MNNRYQRLTPLVIWVIVGVMSYFSETFIKDDDWGELIGIILGTLFLVMSTFFLVGGNMHSLKKNKDFKGKSYSLSHSITYLMVFTVSIPFVIWFTLYIHGYLN